MCFFSPGVQSDGFRLFLRQSVGIDVLGRPCVAPVSRWASNFDLRGLPRRCVQIWSLRLEVILDNEGGADGSRTQDLLEMFDAIKPTEGAVLHEKLDSLRRLVLQRDYDMRGRLDKQAWSFDERMLKCEQDVRRVEQVNADRAFEQRFHHAGTCSQFHLPSGISGDRAADSASEASAHNARAQGMLQFLVQHHHGQVMRDCDSAERQERWGQQ